jgi:Tol biopolymer transport system component
MFINGSYSTPKNLGTVINSKYSESDVLIASDESFIIVTCYGYPQNIGKGDLYISFRGKNGSWTTLTNMGKSLNTEHGEFCPMLSYDGRYFFFSRNKNDTCDVYWVNARIINELKPKNLK